MDLRIQRTKNSIKEAFIELRRRKPIEKITVTELARHAGINKATFYLHYSDIYALSEEIEDALIDELIAGAADNFFDAPKECTNELFKKFMDNRRRLTMVFSGSRAAFFARKIEQRLKAVMYEKRPSFHTKKNDIIISFLVQGMFHTVEECRDDNAQETFNIISQLSDGIVNNLTF